MSTATRPSRASRTWARRTWTYLCGHWELYLFLLPGLVFAMMFRLLPMSKPWGRNKILDSIVLQEVASPIGLWANTL